MGLQDLLPNFPAVFVYWDSRDTKAQYQRQDQPYFTVGRSINREPLVDIQKVLMSCS